MSEDESNQILLDLFSHKKDLIKDRHKIYDSFSKYFWNEKRVSQLYAIDCSMDETMKSIASFHESILFDKLESAKESIDKYLKINHTNKQTIDNLIESNARLLAKYEEAMIQLEAKNARKRKK